MPRRLPPLADLLAFAMVADSGSLTAAALRMNVTQPAISKRVRALEAWLGVALVHRQANRLRLTEAGLRYAAALDQALASMQEATDEIMPPHAGPLRVRAYTTWAMRWLIPRLPAYYARHPGQTVEVTTSILPVDFRHDQVDAAVRMAPTEPAVPQATRLQPFALAPYAAPGTVLATATRLVSQARPRDWASWARQAAVALESQAMAFESTNFAIEAAVKGLGAVIASPLLVERELRDGKLVQAHPAVVPTAESYWLVLPSKPRQEAIAFRDWLLESMQT